MGAKWKAEAKESKKPTLRNLVHHNEAMESIGKEGTTVVFQTPNPPILCTGFVGSVAAAASHLFDFANNDTKDNDTNEDDTKENDVIDNEEDMETESDEHKHDRKPKGCLEGAPLLTGSDESTKVPGVFLVGPTVSHGTLSFCFVYKFRQRFALVAEAICAGLGRDTRAGVTESTRANMYLEDFSCCADTCGDVC